MNLTQKQSTPSMAKQAVSSSFFQPKLQVNTPGDVYEQQADAMADHVMRTGADAISQPFFKPSINAVQRKCAHCEEVEKKLQRKEKSDSENTSGLLLDSYVSGLGGGQPLSNESRSFFEPRFGFDFSNVRVHTDAIAAKSAQSVNALAYTTGNNIVFNSGQYSPQTDAGKKLLAHELTHTIQQGSTIHAKEGDGIIQRYFNAGGTAGSAMGNDYRISDDLTMAVRVGYPNHDFYAQSGKAFLSNILLNAVGSGIRLVEESSDFHVSQGSKTNTLKKISPKNTQNSTSGGGMKMPDDCGTSCAVVVGGNKRGALYHNPITKAKARTSATTPSLMKAEIMTSMLVNWLAMPSTTAPSRTEIMDVITRAAAKQLEIDTAKADYNAAAPGADEEAKGTIYWAKVDQYGEIMMSFYNKMSASKREEIDKYLEINKYATPAVGQGYTMSSGGTKYPGVRTWNFHWAGVVMKSNDQQDTVTLENYAVPGNVENDKWDFAMYGTAAKAGQTFHEQHHDTKQHGDRPTTMVIEKK
ncbi:eCIS core domain-containing protein [Foetidibacter luteolus]|uniref:eCIS core domain-containing protein n=1 Tax=Foetidibacter luteolus TaxID=2608880 RepID=UPI00129C05B6|nr:DUF4157 domain-containing protein [Foetidibacter luteolus]